MDGFLLTWRAHCIQTSCLVLFKMYKLLQEAVRDCRGIFYEYACPIATNYLYCILLRTRPFLTLMNK